MINDLDELMSRDPLSLSTQDIDQIIEYHRRQRARRASGEKAPKPTAVDISSVMKSLKPKAPVTEIKRRF